MLAAITEVAVAGDPDIAKIASQYIASQYIEDIPLDRSMRTCNPNVE
jgi:hypothetical protein